ncbi:MAG: hypothetical protein U9P38_00115 [Campylobacterota bacterium]|nr:hypothetical protein [Campylobacterota bacterium]
MKTILFIYLIFFSGCGIESGSVSTEGNTTIDENVDNNDRTIDDDREEEEVVDDNEKEDIDNNVTEGIVDDGNITEDNTTEEIAIIVDDENVTEESIFDTNGSVFDEFACSLENGYLSLSDTSATPEAEVDGENAIGIGSSYPVYFMPEQSKVVLYYPLLDINKIGEVQSKFTTNYYISLDSSWVDTNSSKVLYVQIPTNDKYPECYRYELNVLDINTTEAVKVYR